MYQPDQPALALVLQDRTDGVNSLCDGTTAYDWIINSAAVTIGYNSNSVASFSGFFSGGVRRLHRHER